MAFQESDANYGLDWPSARSDQKHTDRVGLMRPIPYELCMPIKQEALGAQRRSALSLNISSGGILLLMNFAPEVEQVVKVYVPTPIDKTTTPTLAEVRWTRSISMDPSFVLYCVGLKFLF